MSAALVIEDELHGFHPGSEGNAVVLYDSADSVTIATKYTVPFEDDPDGWEWGLGSTCLNVHDITNLRDYLNGVLAKIGA